MFQFNDMPIRESCQRVSYPPNYVPKCLFSQFNNGNILDMYQSPKKAEEDYDGSSKSDAQYTTKENSSEKKKYESCFLKGFLERLDECSPAKPLYEETQLPKEEDKENVGPANHSEEIAYLLGNYQSKNLKEKPLFKKKLNFQQPSSFDQPKCQKRKKGHFVQQEGDWQCFKCRNINFSFRSSCNKCGMSKEETDRQNDLIFEKLNQLILPKPGEFKLDINGS
ncbi:MAG: zinc finger Ran-binding domain-containing protein [archaeon]|nr:zinc finger Ran-binding domain-containing protein [archaeon]